MTNTYSVLVLNFNLSESDEALPWNMMCGPSQLGQVEAGRQDK